MFVPFLFRQTHQRPVLGASELQRRLSVWQGAEGEVPGATNEGRRVPPNRLGLCDMHGNVLQWSADLLAPTGADRVVRGVRGSGWGFHGTLCQTAYRFGIAPTHRNFNHGFRLVRVSSR